MKKDPPFTLGIEEEYLLVDPVTRDLVAEPPADLLAACDKAAGGRVRPEFLRSQIEVGTGVCQTVPQAAAEIRELRAIVGRVAAERGLAIIAASTHPFARWDRQRHTDKDRYNELARNLQGVVKRLVICGMHVHVGLDDDDLRIDLMSQVGYFTPHLLALSTSSPFWAGQDTGLQSWRLTIFDELPRTGPAEMFDSWGEYQRHLNILIGAGLIDDASKLWWDLRPSARFPTLELRIPDVCTSWRDGAAIAALYQALLHRLWRLKRGNQRWRRYANMLVRENRWRAQRYGIDEGLVDFGKGSIVPYGELLEELLALVAEDCATLGSSAEALHARSILTRGTSAHRQRATFNKAIAEGAEPPEALRRVVDFLIAETLADT